jgi:hypothetical protein
LGALQLSGWLVKQKHILHLTIPFMPRGLNDERASNLACFEQV